MKWDENGEFPFSVEYWMKSCRFSSDSLVFLKGGREVLPIFGSEKNMSSALVGSQVSDEWVAVESASRLVPGLIPRYLQ